MKTLHLIALAGLTAGFSGHALAKAEIGQPAPAFTLTDTEGRSHSLADYAGKTVVLEWTNYDCPFVRKHYDGKNMQAQQKAAGDSDTVWLTVNSSAPGKQGHVTPERAKELMGSDGWAGSGYLLDPDGTAGRAYEARTTPHMYIIDGDGVLRYKGGIDSNPSANPADIAGATQYVQVALGQLAAGEAIAEANTRPYGCAVKYAD